MQALNLKFLSFFCFRIDKIYIRTHVFPLVKMNRRKIFFYIYWMRFYSCYRWLSEKRPSTIPKFFPKDWAKLKGAIEIYVLFFLVFSNTVADAEKSTAERMKFEYTYLFKKLYLSIVYGLCT